MGLLDVLPWICGLVALVGAGVYGGSPYPTGAIVFYGLTLVLFALGWFFDAVVPVVCGYFASFTYYLVVQLMHVPADLLDFKKYSMLVPAAMGLWNLIGYKVGQRFAHPEVQWLIAMVLGLSGNIASGLASGYAQHYPGYKYALYLLGTTMLYFFTVFGLMRGSQKAICRETSGQELDEQSGEELDE
eukprot:gnl/TRDRNA2_/TRDRNA2_82259_c0_seq2.p1 gnl/TRDRNA2_/TRDRNA2_82259_c0~~gnl/TRDRNA2_/TRDRNA2_82259_c0_seq2.p1  ORF type:complete len:207 (+),score=11.97 gnl/TRDRNA2_/TRDRNA2_82259_c0_seq2:62-622(+)